MRLSQLAIPVAIVALLVAWAFPADAQERSRLRIDAKSLECAAAYYQAAVDYRAGRTETALDALAGLDRTLLRTVLAVLERAESESDETGELAAFRWGLPMLRAAGMLHVEAAVQALRSGQSDDFRFHSTTAMQVFAMARSSSPEAEATRTFGLRSARALGRALLGVNSLELGREYLELATRRFPTDAPMLILFGTLLEAAGETTPRRFDAGTDIRRTRTERDAELREAARLFERALEVDPHLLEAQVRLARVYTLTSRDDRAASILEEVLRLTADSVDPFASDESTDAAWVYLSRLLLGEIHERAGRTDSAMTLYREALAMPGRGQAAYIALSELLLRLGDQTAAVSLLEEFFARQQAAPMWEPWWEYPFGRPPQGFEVIIGLRDEVQGS